MKNARHILKISLLQVSLRQVLYYLCKPYLLKNPLHLQRQSLKRQPQLLRLSLSLHRQHLLQLKTCQQPLWSGSHVERRRHGV